MASTAFERISNGYESGLIAVAHSTPLEFDAWDRACQYKNELASGQLSLNDPSVLSRVEFIARVASNWPSVGNLIRAHRDTEAQNLLNAMQMWLDTVVDHPERANVLFLFFDMARGSDKLPDQLFLAPGAAQIERLPRCKGPHSLIHFGRYMEQAVVAKRMAIVKPSEKYLRLIGKEALVWRQLRHPRLARFIGLESGRTHDISIINVRYEQETIASRRELYPMLSRKRNRLLQDVAEGLKYLHINKVIHGNIKPDNVLVETVDNDLRAVICDFGLALVEESLDNHAMTLCSRGYRGTPGWSDTLPPWSEEEIWIRWRPDRDIYGFGLVALWLCTGKAMWSRDRQFLPIAPPPTRPGPEDCILSPLSDELWRLLLTCWVGPPDHRPTAGQLYEAFIVNADVF